MSYKSLENKSELLAATSEEKLKRKFFLAADRADIKTVTECIRAGVNINCTDITGRTIFHIAAANGDLALILAILKYPQKDLNIQSLDFLLTPLHEAVLTDRIEIVAEILKAGAKVNIPNAHGCTAVHIAVRSRSMHILQLLTTYKANLNVVDSFSNTPLSIAILDIKDYPICVTLLKQGARVNKNRPQAMYIFHEAVLNTIDASEIVLLKLLVKNGAFINYVDPNGKNALHYAAISGMPELIAYLLQLGVKISVKDKTGRTPFDVVVQHEHATAIDIMRSYMTSQKPSKISM